MTYVLAGTMYVTYVCGTAIQDEPREAVTQVVAAPAPVADAAANDSYRSQTQIHMVTLSNGKR